LDARQAAQRGHRIFRLARWLYEEGYDVHVLERMIKYPKLGRTRAAGELL
jgi:hypothetical protein